jgi:uncharacterized protein YcaQ
VPPATETAARLTWENVLAWRLRRQHLRRRAPRKGALDVASAIGGLHAQLLSSAELTLWARVDDLGPDDLSRALWTERSLIKTWAMRGTLHLLPAAQLPVWQAALGTRRGYRSAAWLRYFDLTPATLDAVLDAVAQALDGPPLTREELAGAVARLTGTPSLGEKMLGSWGSLLKPAAFQGRLCFAPSRGPNVCFTRPDRWLAGRPGGAGPAVDPEEALRQVTRAYLAAYGPATREELARWWGETPPRAGRMLAALGDAAVRVELEGAAPGGGAPWMLAEDVAPAATATLEGAVRLLPAFDQYVVTAPRDPSPVIPPGTLARIYRPQGWLSPVLLKDGRIAGVWRHERRGASLDVAVEPFAPLPAGARRAVAAEAERLAAFTGGTLRLTWRP